MTLNDHPVAATSAQKPSRFSWQGPRLRLWPILLVFVLGMGVLQASFTAATVILKHTDVSLLHKEWPLLMIAESFEFLLGLLGIAIARKWLPKADFGLRWPRKETMIGKAILWGTAFGIIMLLVDQGARLVRGHAPTVPAVHAADIAGLLTFELFQVGICEELLFRGFLMGLLMELSPSRVRIGNFTLSTAGYTIAVLFALAHAANFWTMAWPLALGQQLYAIALGVLYAWMRERSGSLAAPMVAHSISDFVEYVIVFALAHLLPPG